MSAKLNISIQVPRKENNSYFSLKLKGNLLNERDVYSSGDQIFVISDIEGNFQSFCKILLKAKIINKYLQWTFGDNHLVIAGDCFDRGEQVTECLWLIYSLEEKARKKGGCVHFILGNHEIMNLNGDWRYIHPKYADKGAKNHHTALYYGNNELWHWLCTKNIIEKIGDVLFVHGGISHELLNQKLSIHDINSLARPYYARASEIFADPFLSLVFNSQNSPFWYRGYYTGGVTEELIDATLHHFGVKTIVTGHTVLSNVTGYFNNKVINVNNNREAINEGLLIKKNKFYRLLLKGKRERIK